MSANDLKVMMLRRSNRFLVKEIKRCYKIIEYLQRKLLEHRQDRAA